MNYTKIKPLGTRILVKRLVAPSKTQGGILLPENQGAKNKVAMVSDVGPGKYNHAGSFIKTNIKPGDFVLLPDYGGVRVPPQQGSNEEFFIYQEDDILGIVNDNLNDKI